MSETRADKAARYRARVRRQRREDYMQDCLERAQQQEEQEWQDDGCYQPGGADIVPPRRVRLFGWAFLVVFFLGAMLFFGCRVNWYAPIALCLIVGVCILPTAIEFMCRGTRVLKHDRASFIFWR